jgi:hypothetical protein
MDTPTPRRQSASQETRDLLIRIDERVGRLVRAVEGNGSPGLSKRMDTAEQAIVEIKEDLADYGTALINHLDEAKGHIKTIGQIQESISQHLETDKVEREKAAKRSQMRASWWDRVGMEAVKMFITSVGAALTAYLLILLKLGQ